MLFASLRLLLRGFLDGLLLFESRAREGVHETVVPLMACMLEQRSLRLQLHHRKLCCPRFRPCLLIFNGESVQDRVGVHAREPFGDAHVLAGSSKCQSRKLPIAHARTLVVEVPGLDNQRITLPTAARASDPLANV